MPEHTAWAATFNLASTPATLDRKTGDSCYWARLSGLSGGLRRTSSPMTSCIARGQFYVEVKSTDSYFTVRCEVTPLAEWPVPSQPLSEIGTGMYIVGRDIAAGIYAGNPGSEDRRLLLLGASQRGFRRILATSSPMTLPGGSSTSRSSRLTATSRSGAKSSHLLQNGLFHRSRCRKLGRVCIS